MKPDEDRGLSGDIAVTIVMKSVRALAHVPKDTCGSLVALSNGQIMGWPTARRAPKCLQKRQFIKAGVNTYQETPTLPYNQKAMQ